MPRQLTPKSSLENLKREAKRWLNALRANDEAARARLERVASKVPAEPTLRFVQHALALEYDVTGWTALAKAVAEVRARTGDPNAARDAALQALLMAASEGDASRVVRVLDSHPGIINDRGALGQSGLRTALHFGVRHAAVVRALLERGADPNVRDQGDDAMPLHFAAERGDLDVVRLLVEHGADPVGDGTDHDLNVLGWATCFDYVDHPEVAAYLLAHGAEHTLVSAVAMGDTQTIRELARRSPADLERPMDGVNRRRHPLHLAVVKKRPESVRTLLELSADLEATDAAGLTPLDQATIDDEREIAALLVERGAEVRLPAAMALERWDDVARLLQEDPQCLQPGHRYGTLIVRASERASRRVIETLLQHGAAVNVHDDPRTSVDNAERFTPLHAAAFRGNVDAIAVLLAHGADPRARESKYCGTPAGWAQYAGHVGVRDMILEKAADPFDAIDFDLPERIPSIVRQEPWLLNRRYSECGPCDSRLAQWWPQPWHTPLVWAVMKNKPDAVRALLEQGAHLIVAPDGRSLVDLAREAGHERIVTMLEQHERGGQTHAEQVRLFIKSACPDHDIRGGPAHVSALHTAQRILKRHPEIAHDSFYTAVVCGEHSRVERDLAGRPEIANERGGPKHWEPLLYLCFTRLLLAASNEHAVAIGTALLDHGANPNASFMAGDSPYTPLVGVIGEGEEDRPPHPQRDELATLLLDHGAEPYDKQVVYNIHFRGHVLWFLQLIYDRSVALGRGADWDDPDWSMLDMGGYGNGARWHLDIAVKRNDLELATWLLTHGANPNAPPARDKRSSQRTLYAEAVRLGHSELADLLVRYGAHRDAVRLEANEAFVAASLRLDRAHARILVDQHPELLRSTQALFAAAERDHVDAAELLLDLGVSPNVEDDHQQRALHVAAYHGSTRVAALLVQRGAEIDPVESRWGNTPLGAAVYAQRGNMIELLGQRSRDIWTLTYTGNVERLRSVLRETPELARVVSESAQTPLMCLPPDDEGRALEVARLLLAHGADPSIRCKEGQTAADRADQLGLYDVALLLR